MVGDVRLDYDRSVPPGWYVAWAVTQIACVCDLQCSCVFWGAVPLLLFCLQFPNRKELNKLLAALVHQDQRRGTSTTLSEIRSSMRPNHRPSVVVSQSVIKISVNLEWLLPKIKKFAPENWYFSDMLLIMRLAQTSLMLVFRDQKTQAMLACCVAVMSACIHRELNPYRRPSVSESRHTHYDL